MCRSCAAACLFPSSVRGLPPRLRGPGWDWITQVGAWPPELGQRYVSCVTGSDLCRDCWVLQMTLSFTYWGCLS